MELKFSDNCWTALQKLPPSSAGAVHSVVKIPSVHMCQCGCVWTHSCWSINICMATYGYARGMCMLMCLEYNTWLNTKCIFIHLHILSMHPFLNICACTLIYAYINKYTCLPFYITQG